MVKRFFPSFPHFKFTQASIVFLVLFCLSVFSAVLNYWMVIRANNRADNFYHAQENASQQLLLTQQELNELKTVDQYQRNEQLQQTIGNIEKTYQQLSETYEELVDFNDQYKPHDTFNTQFALTLATLGKREYVLAQEQLKQLSASISAETVKQQQRGSVGAPANISASNTPPGSGFQQQAVEVNGTKFVVSIVAADLSQTKVIVDTASENNCGNDCPVLSLGDYVSRNGAFAGINGTYFCPASYPTCAGKTNSFDLLVMNKNKTYFNSDNNVYSQNPGVIFGGGSIRFVRAVQEWGRDTSIDSMLSNYPLLVSGGSATFGGDDDAKKSSVGNRSFVANKGNTVYIGVVHGASVANAAQVLQALGMENALNLDSGGSTALWSGGYKVGPGRNIPNAILFVRR
jgi:hypothetical protein